MLVIITDHCRMIFIGILWSDLDIFSYFESKTFNSCGFRADAGSNIASKTT